MFLRFANFYQQFIWDFSQIAMLLISILRITSGLIASKFIHISEGNIEGDGSSNIVDEADTVGKTNLKASKSRMRFYTLEVKC